jgi:hypothetical protein
VRNVYIVKKNWLEKEAAMFIIVAIICIAPFVAIALGPILLGDENPDSLCGQS